MKPEAIMISTISIIFIGLALLCIYGLGVFAMCLQAGESLVSAAIHAANWLIAFSISHIFGYLAITLH
jgi:hypothetical protein